MATMPSVSLSVFNHVLYALRNFNQSNSEALLNEFEQYIGFGVEGDILVLQSCLHYLNVFPKDLKTMPVDVVLEKIFRDLLQKPNFSTIFSEAFEGKAISGDFLEQICNRLHLETAERIQIGFALSVSEDQKLRMCGKTFCTSQTEMLRASQPYVDSVEQIHNIVLFLLQSDSLSEHVSYYIRMLVREQSEVEKDYILQPFLSSELPRRISARNVDLVSGSSGYDFDALHDEMQNEIDASEVMIEMGYGCTNDVSQCKSMLSHFSPLTESMVANILGKIARTHADLDENQISFMEFCSILNITSSDLTPMKTWNIDVLVDSIKQLAPGINWVSVIEHLDHEGFYIPDRAAFSLLMSMFRGAFKRPFPLDAICGSVWKNAEGQLSFLKHAVLSPPELFNFSHSERQLSYVGGENGHKNEAGNAWLCLDLLEVLCHLAERGHASSVRQMLEHPLKHCPELLLLGMAHIHILPQVLELLPFNFGIRLATFGSNAELLDLEKWIAVSLATYKDNFFKECLKFLKEAQSVADHDLSSETRSIFFKALQAYTYSSSSAHLTKELEKLSQMFMDAGDKHNAPSSVLLSSAASSLKSKSTVGASETLAPSTSFTIPSGSSLPKFDVNNIETLVAAAKKREIPIAAPGSEIQDRISFIMNNLSSSDMEAKSKELTEYLKEEHYSWFAQYLVIKRLSIEPDHHDMYLMLLDRINLKTLNREVLQSTYENCKVLLASELIVSSAEERQLLKNLGSWLGKITIGRDHYLRGLDINPKALIIEAYEKGSMIAVVPFVSRILEALKTTRAYKPPNPWTMAVLGLLVEIYSFPNLKLNLKFEIKALFIKLGMDIINVNPTSHLKDRVRQVEGNSDFPSTDLELPESHKVSEVNTSTSSTSFQTHVLLADITNPSHSSGHSVVSSQHAAAFHNASATLRDNEKPDDLQLSAPPATLEMSQSQPLTSNGQFPSSTYDIVQQVNPKLNALGLPLEYQSLLPVAMDRAIKEIVSSIVECSVAVAIKTTMDIVLKDFAMESDETRVQNAARDMVTNLACGLSHAICKEPLRNSISSQLGNLLQNSCISEELFEQIRQIFTDDNLNLGCEMILQAVSEKAVQSIDAEIGKEFRFRRLRPDLDRCILDSKVVLPKSLCPTPGNLSTSQQQVYEGFARLPWKKQSTQTSDAAVAASASVVLSGSRESSSAPVETVSKSKNVYRVKNPGAPQTLEKDAICTSVPSSSASELQLANRYEVVKVTAHCATSKEDKHADIPEPFFYNINNMKLAKLVDEWYDIYKLGKPNDEECAQFVLKLFNIGVLNDRVLHILLHFSVSNCLSSSELNNPTTQPNGLVKQSHLFMAIDVYAELVLAILKFYPGDDDSDILSILSKVLKVTVNYIKEDSEAKKQLFNSRPYYRLFFNLLRDLPSLEPLSDGVNVQVMIALAEAFHFLQPLQIPGFSYAWLELVSHRNFMPKFLVGNRKMGWLCYQRLLILLLQFLEPYLRNAKLSEAVSLLYKCTLRVFLVLLTDFPEFLCDYHFSFCDILPSSCIQLRNLILCAHPPHIKIGLLPEITQPPRIRSDVETAIKVANIKSSIDAYIMTRQLNCQFIHELKQKLLLNLNEASRLGTRYNVPLINSIVLYVGMQIKVQALELFKNLIVELDFEGSYLFLNAMANQLRYPNTHTYDFSWIILCLFEDSNQVIQEQISRVLLERILVHKPHPWGLLITFFALVKNPVYNFWSRPFLKCAPEIEKAFLSALETCEGHSRPTDYTVNEN